MNYTNVFALQYYFLYFLFQNITESGISISYSVNGVSQSEAVSIPLTDVPENFALFPHVLSRNCAFQLNLGSQEESWFAKPEEFNDYEFLDKVESKIAGPARPENRNDCEVHNFNYCLKLLLICDVSGYSDVWFASCWKNSLGSRVCAI
jgi:hypothetical protein